MSGDPRAEKYLNTLNLTREEILPFQTESRFFNEDNGAWFVWKMGGTSYSLTNDSISRLIDGIAINSDTVLVFNFGTGDLRGGISRHNNPEEVAIKYFNTIRSFCEFNGLNFYVTRPPSLQENFEKFNVPQKYSASPEHFDKFENALILLLGDRYLIYPDHVLKRNFEPSDWFAHIKIEDGKKMTNFILDTIKLGERNDNNN
jgi:hypothetical protein